MSWVLVPPLAALRTQLDRIAPRRDKASDGIIGDTSHAASPSSHNPDRSGIPEWRDGDSKDEVRGVDLDADLKVPGLSMGRVVQHLVQGCRDGWIWWLEYIIYRGRIWTRSGGWATQRYNGSNPHDSHAHVNGRFTNKADNFTGADYRLEGLVDDMPDIKEIRTMTQEVVRTEIRAALETRKIPWQGKAGERLAAAGWSPMTLAALTTYLFELGRKSATGLASALAAIELLARDAADDATADQVAALRDDVLAAVDGVDEAVMDRIGSGETPEETAAILTAILGDRAEAVFRAGLSRG